MLRPMGNRVLVKPAEHTGMSKGGIHLPNEELPTEGTVQAVGPGERTATGVLVPLEVNVGDRVVFSKRAGTEVKLEGEKLLLLHSDEILAVKEESAPE